MAKESVAMNTSGDEDSTHGSRDALQECKHFYIS